MSRLENILNGENTNAIYPFFWQHGETHPILKEYIEKIYSAGIKAFCIESRPHPAYGKEGWWDDLMMICEEAKKRDMKIWILDDAKFPTGYANGAFKEEYRNLRKRYLDYRRFDVVGPLKNGRIIMKYLKGKPWEQKDREEDQILGVFAAKRNLNVPDGEIDLIPETLIDITDHLKEGILYYDIPEGVNCIFAVFETYLGGEESTKDHLNPLDKASVEILLKEVYESHYEHLKEYFGDTITAFFSDEPRFGNHKGCESRMGTKGMVLPWKHGLEDALPFGKEELVLLFEKAQGAEEDVRYKYMNMITDLYAQNFSEVLGDWCRQHGIDYVGHQIEDNGAHTRLGYGCGHLFRAQKGQTYAGIDVISNQIAPGYDFYHDSFATEGHHGEFYHYALALLGSSIAQLDPKKNGRAMCEAFGAYGWNEGLKLMKWITDHLLVHGINHIVPHAFNPKTFPDWDCPPHFYANGNNPQYRYYHLLNEYTNRLCALLQNGIHETPIAVLYHAEAEWYGNAMPVEKVLRELSHEQIESMIVSADALAEMRETGHNFFKIYKNQFSCLIIPYSHKLPETLLMDLKEISDCGCEVIFIDDYPCNFTDLHLMECIRLDQIGRFVKKYANVKLSNECKEIVTYRYETEDETRYFLFQEHPYKTYKGFIDLKAKGIPVLYDAYQNQCKKTAYKTIGEFIRIPIELNPYESCMVIFRECWKNVELKEKYRELLEKEEWNEKTWKVQVSDAQHYPVWGDPFVLETLEPLSNRKEYLDHTGTARYETEFEVENIPENLELDLGEVYEIAEVFINGISAGTRICPPYQFDISKFVKQGKNELVVEVTNNLGNQCKEFMTQYMPVEPFGLIGPVKLKQR